MLKLLSLIIFLSSIFCISCSDDTNWSKSMTDAFIVRHPNLVAYDSTKLKWDYEQGLMLHAIWEVYQRTKIQKYYDYVKTDVDKYVNDDGTINDYNIKKYRLDDIATGRVVLDLYKSTGEDKYKKAALILRQQLAQQPRTSEGGFWHKEIYTEQMWLDGLYMAEPFYAEYAKVFDEPADYEDITRQFILMAKHAKDPKTRLFYHGWDSSKKQKWADPLTGNSPSFWGRAMGWYLMGIVDVLDYLPLDNPDREKLISILQDLSNTLLKYREPKSGLWYLIVDKANIEGNYLEASSSAMFMYVFAKGANKGYLDKKYFDVAKKILDGLADKLIKNGDDGYPNIINTIAGAGLGGNPYRDGTFNYYINEKKRVNDFKAIGPFILGALELGK